MHLLLSNDDGIHASGLKLLADALAPLGKITVVAPGRNRSAASNSLTLERPIRAQQVAKNWYSVDGTPTDCVHLAITGLLDEEPEYGSCRNRRAILGLTCSCNIFHLF